MVAFNHGINRIRGKNWNAYLKEFEERSVSSGMPLSDLVAAFRSFMDPTVSAELSANTLDDAIGFVFCACPSSTSPEVRELFWKRSICVEEKQHRGLVRTGDGARYLNQELQANPHVNTVDYWAQLDVEEGLFQLEALFTAAANARQQEEGQEFSDSFDKDILKCQQTASGDV